MSFGARFPLQKAQMVQPRKPDIQRQHHRQHELVHRHGAREPLDRQRLLDQSLKPEFLQHGRDGKQSAVRGQIPAGKVIERGRCDFKGLRTNRANPLHGALFLVILSIVIHLLGGS